MSEQLDDFKTALTKNQVIIDTLKRERDQLRTVVNQIHVSVGEDPASDDETLPEVVTAIKSTVDYQRYFREEINRLRELLRRLVEAWDMDDELGEAEAMADARAALAGMNK